MDHAHRANAVSAAKAGAFDEAEIPRILRIAGHSG